MIGQTLIADKLALWGPGPWVDEPDRVEWKHAGLPCLITRNPQLGNLCGYVAVPPGHPKHGADPDAVDVSVHGGLNYAAPCQGRVCHVPAPGEPDDVYWFGFDAAHCFDVMPNLHVRGFYQAEGDVYRDVVYMRKHVERLAEHLAAEKAAP